MDDGLSDLTRYAKFLTAFAKSSRRLLRGRLYLSSLNPIISGGTRQ